MTAREPSEWAQRMARLEDENGPLPPSGASGGHPRKPQRYRVTSIPLGVTLRAGGVVVEVGDVLPEGCAIETEQTIQGAWAPAANIGCAVLDVEEGARVTVPTVADGFAVLLDEPRKIAITKPPPLTEAELAEIESREKMATPGPWKWEHNKLSGSELRSGDDAILWSTMPYHDTTDLEGGAGDEAFIAAARTDIPRLLADVRRLRAIPTLGTCSCEAPNIVAGLIPACANCGHVERVYRLSAEVVNGLEDAEIAALRTRISALEERMADRRAADIEAGERES